MIIDVHTHIGKLPDSKFSESYEKNLEFLLAEMKENQIDQVFVIAGFSKDEGFNLNSANLIELAQRNDAIHAIASLNVLAYTETDLAQLEQWLSNGFIKGIKLYTGYQHFYPSDERCQPIYDLCAKYNVPVIFHSGDTLAGYVTNPKLKYSHPLHIDDVAADRPELKIIIAHMGNPWLIDCAELLYKNPNVYADISGLIVGDSLETPYGATMSHKIGELIDYVGSNKLLYGTDWPLCPMNTYLDFVKTLKLPQESLDELLYKNAIKLFGLKLERDH